jgi:hypothetical protein
MRLIASEGVEAQAVTLTSSGYIMYDHMQQVVYGVVQVVNQMVVEENWRVVGFALNQNMFCDIAIRRAG